MNPVMANAAAWLIERGRFALPRESPHPVPLPQGERGLCRTASPQCPLASPLHPLELIDEAADHAEALVPEGGVGGVEAERRQQLLVALGAAGAQHVQILLGEALGRPLI